ncbi:hypothetical protein Syun_028604 [Stephania yunnanensis]|uniref:non-specific serine/threonine protein kinase n=1 Tax=Stephania yunnanensis TaxID=152371 RepID=A0AAP0E6I2_9MAGN
MAMNLNAELSKKTNVLGLKVWVLIGIFVGVFIVSILCVLYCLTYRKKARRATDKLPVSQIPIISKEIKEVKVEQIFNNRFISSDGILIHHLEKSSDKEADRLFVNSGMDKKNNGDNNSELGSFRYIEKDNVGSQSDEHGSSGGVTTGHRPSASYPIAAPSPLTGLPEFSHLGWGHWFTLRDLDQATNRFSKENVIGEGGYGAKLRKNSEMLVYEYVNNGNLEQWLHGAMRQHGYLTWEARLKVLLGTAKALAYLHEAIEPKVVHRDIKSSNILIDDEFNAKVSDFGLAKLLGAGKSHITTRVMGTFGYVAPEYANTGLLNEKSDVYSFGVLLLEAITGRDPVDYARPAPEVNLVDWLKMMVGSRRSVEVVDPNIETRPSTRALKRALLTALRCVDPDSDKRPKMSQVVRMLESEEYPIPREDRRHRRNQVGSGEIDAQKENSDAERSDNPDSRLQNKRNHGR